MADEIKHVGNLVKLGCWFWLGELVFLIMQHGLKDT